LNNSALLDTIESAGVSLRLIGGKLKASGAEKAIASIKPYIAHHRDEIIRALESDYYPTFEDIALLDNLINQLCDLQGDSPQTREVMLDARRKMRPVLIPENIAQLRLWIAEVNHSEIMKGRA
jgi:hypothetical protein